MKNSSRKLQMQILNKVRRTDVPYRDLEDLSITIYAEFSKVIYVDDWHKMYHAMFKFDWGDVTTCPHTIITEVEEYGQRRN